MPLFGRLPSDLPATGPVFTVVVSPSVLYFSVTKLLLVIIVYSVFSVITSSKCSLRSSRFSLLSIVELSSVSKLSDNVVVSGGDVGVGIGFKVEVDVKTPVKLNIGSVTVDTSGI